jgi:hypothetical protein
MPAVRLPAERLFDKQGVFCRHLGYWHKAADRKLYRLRSLSARSGPTRSCSFLGRKFRQPVGRSQRHQSRSIRGPAA